ncbi:probable methyltransferase PMT11 isoform X1 [Phalaenopsis equestris]|uniref:probable methyltransferase PMT11 isoform X1 n=1 Tax=Phalaenopsis equestris TaxID=78828 RepID=UPI0009E3EDA0|nr:probable methyltransferase PMT11 isoform X1 [Phalaenopsis equestris]
MLKSPHLITIASIVLGCVAAFFLGKHWSEGSQQLMFFYSSTGASEGHVAISPNANRTFDISSLISDGSTSPPPPPPHPPPPPAAAAERFGVVNENGEMSDRFDTGALNTDLVESLGMGNETEEASGEQEGAGRVVRVAKFRSCSTIKSEYIPCLDNWEEIKKLNSTERGEKFERHCPEVGKGLNCLVPAPKNYKTRIPWPKSRDEIWFNNVPHTRLVEDKGGQNWIIRDKDKFKFPGGGTQFIHGANQYLNQISEMVSDILFGSHTRVVLDVGCGVASFGAYLFSKNAITMSIAPKDVHENQIQFALERGVPAMVAAFATRRMLYPSQAFDLIHCSRCRINWTRDDGILLLEANRMLRAGGYFAWAAQPVYKHEEAQQETWKEMEDLTARICWVLVKKEGYIALWRKPLNNTCYINRDAAVRPPLCNPDDNPDSVWYVNLKKCITRLPENGFGSNVPSWPARLHVPPQRLQNLLMDANIAKNELFKAETSFWDEVVGSYVSAFHWKKLNLRNVMDMRAGFGGFAAAMIDNQLDSWVMNVVPTSGPNTLPLIYDRGLIGVAHDWFGSPFFWHPSSEWRTKRLGASFSRVFRGWGPQIGESCNKGRALHSTPEAQL